MCVRVCVNVCVCVYVCVCVCLVFILSLSAGFRSTGWLGHHDLIDTIQYEGKLDS